MGFRGRRASNCGNGEPESSATTAATLDAHLATVGLDDGLDDGQAETDPIFAAARGGRVAIVRLEEPMLVFVGNARTSIGDRQTYCVAVGNDRQINRAVRRAELAGVENQVDQDLAQATAVANDLGHAVRKPHAQT